MGYERALNRYVYLYLYSYAFSTMGIKLHSLDRSQGSTVTGTRIFFFFRVIYKFDTRETTTEAIEKKGKKTSSRFLLISSCKDNELRILAIEKGNLILD